MIKRKYFMCSDDSDYSEMINRWVDHDGQMMKWACKIFDKASLEESKKLVPFEKPLFYCNVGKNKIILSYENTGKYHRYNVNVDELGCILCNFDTFYDLLKWLYTDKVERDLSDFLKALYDQECSFEE